MSRRYKFPSCIVNLGAEFSPAFCASHFSLLNLKHSEEMLYDVIT